MASDIPKGVRMGWLERRLKDKRIERTLQRYGGIQTCPWCKQCTQDNNVGWHFDPDPTDDQNDILTCGVCSGRSLWFFGLGMHYLRALDHPAMKEIKRNSTLQFGTLPTHVGEPSDGN